MHHGSQFHSKLVTTPSSCISLTLQSVLTLNLTCPLTSSWRAPMTLDTLKDELKPPFTANVTKNPLLHADKNGEHPCEENLNSGNKNVEHKCGENVHGDNLNPHNINKLSCSHQSPQETQPFSFLSFPLVLLDLNINPPRSMNPLQRNTSSITMLGKFLNTHPYLMVPTT